LDKPAGLLVRDLEQRPPLGVVERRRGEDRSCDGKAVRGKIFKEAEGQWKRRDGTCRGSAQAFVDLASVRADRFERLRDRFARGVGSGARDEVNQLPPANRNVVAVAGRLIQNGQQAIVETHRFSMSSKTHPPLV